MEQIHFVFNTHAAPETAYIQLSISAGWHPAYQRNGIHNPWSCLDEFTIKYATFQLCYNVHHTSCSSSWLQCATHMSTSVYWVKSIAMLSTVSQQGHEWVSVKQTIQHTWNFHRLITSHEQVQISLIFVLFTECNWPTLCTELYHSFIWYTGSYIFRHPCAIFRELLISSWLTWK
jgi:hypothetical protein